MLAAALLLHALVLAPHTLVEAPLWSSVIGAVGASFALASIPVGLVGLAAAALGLAPDWRPEWTQTVFRALGLAVPGAVLGLAWAQFRPFEGQLNWISLLCVAGAALAGGAGGAALALLTHRRGNPSPPGWGWVVAWAVGVALGWMPAPPVAWPPPAPADLTAAGTAVPTAPPRASLPHMVLLITIDTLRADHMSLYGYSRSTTPFLERLASEGALVQHMSAAATCTVPATVAILSSAYPWCSGVTDQFLGKQLPDAFATLPERYREWGYQTVALVTNPLINEDTGIAQGFDDFHSLPFNQPYPSAVALNRMVLRRVDAVKHEPFFLWIHFMDPHYPYHPPESTYADFLDDDLYDDERLPAIRFGHRGGARRDRTLSEADYRNPVEAGYLVARYDGEIRLFDRALGSLFDELGARGLLEDAAVALTADHGEGLGEHGLYFQHCQDAYESDVHVPALFWRPGTVPAGRTITTPATHVDVAVTLLELSGIPAAGDPTVQGVDLLSRQPRPRPVFSQSAWWDGLTVELMGEEPLLPTRTVLEDGWKYVLTPAHELAQVRGIPSLVHAWRSLLNGVWRPGALYHLPSDPSEMRDRAADEPERARRLRTLVERYPTREDWTTCPGPRGGGTAMSEEAKSRMEERLKALGYME